MTEVEHDRIRNGVTRFNRKSDNLLAMKTGLARYDAKCPQASSERYHRRLLTLPALFLTVSFLCTGCGGSTGGGSSSGGLSSGSTDLSSYSSQLWQIEVGGGSLPPLLSGQSNPPGNQLNGLAVDTSGDVLICGSTLGAFPGYSNPSDTAHAVVAALDGSGKSLWTTEFGTGAGDFLNSIAVDSAGNSYAGGVTLGAYSGFSNPSGLPEGVVAKLSSTGAVEWQQQLALGSQSTYVDAAAAAGGNLYVVGTSNDGTGISTQKMFVAEMDPSNGQTVWMRQYGPSDSVSSLTVDANGDLIVAGVSSGAFPGNANGSSTPFVGKFSGSSGAVIWMQQFSSLLAKGYAYVSTVAMSPDGSIVFGGAFSTQDSFAIGYGADPAAELLVGRLDDASGSVAGEQEIGNGGGAEVSSVTVNSAGNIYATGITNGTFSNAFQASLQNTFVMRFSSALQAQWVEQFGTGGIINVSGLTAGPIVAASPDGNLIEGSVIQGSLAGPASPSDDVEMYLAKFGS